MRYPYSGFTKDQNGRIIQSAVVSVYLAGSSTAASIYAAETGGTAVNSVTSDSNGQFSFWVDDGNYAVTQKFKISVSKAVSNVASYGSVDIDDVVIFTIGGGGLVYYPDPSVADQTNGALTGSIQSLLTTIGTVNKATIELQCRSAGGSTYIIPQNADWSAYTNVTWKIRPGAILQVATTKTLTIGGPFEIGLYKVFDCVGTGKVVFGSNDNYFWANSIEGVRPEWWGAKADDSTDCTAALNAAVIAGGNATPVLLSFGTYRVGAGLAADTVAVYLTGSVKGVSATGSVIKNVGAGTAVSLGFASGFQWSQDVSYSDFSVMGDRSNGVYGSGQDGIWLNSQYTGAGHQVQNRKFTNVRSIGHGRHGLVIRNAWAATFVNCRFDFNAGLGVYNYSESTDADVGTAFGTTRLIGPSGNATYFIGCSATHNGGDADVSGNYLHGGVRFATGTGIHWIGGDVEFNNAWGFILGGTSGDPAFLLSSASVTHAYIEGCPNELSTTGGAIAVLGAWEEITIADNYIVPGAAAGKTCYGLYIVGDANNTRTRIVEKGNYIRVQGNGGTEIAKHIEGICPGKEIPIHRISNILIEDGTDAAHIKVTLGNVWNGDSYAITDNIGKDGITTGVWQLDATGSVLTLVEAGMSRTILAVAAVTISMNFSATAFIVSGAKSASTMQLTFKNAATGGALDLTTLVDTGVLAINVYYIAGEYNGNY